MINTLSIKESLLVTGAKNHDPSVYVPPNPMDNPSPLFKDMPSFQVIPSPPMFEPTFHGAGKDYVHAGVSYHPNPNLTIGVNAVIDKHGNVPYSQITMGYLF